MGLRDFLRSIVDHFFGSTEPEQPQRPSRPQEQRPPLSGYPTSPRPEQPARKQGPPYPDRNKENQQNAYYNDLRTRAKEEAARMGQNFDESHAAYARGNGALAKELSNKGKAHQREMNRLNDEASEWIFTQNNKDCTPDEVDLHGLFVKEAITYSERAIKNARSRGASKIQLIVGKGLHSSDGTAKLKPAIEALMREQGLVAELDPNNAGVLIVSLDGRPSGHGTVIQSDEISQRLQGKDGGCILM